MTTKMMTKMTMMTTTPRTRGAWSSSSSLSASRWWWSSKAAALTSHRQNVVFAPKESSLRSSSSSSSANNGGGGGGGALKPRQRRKRTVHVETYGCQMNVSDSEVVASVLTAHGYELVDFTTQRAAFGENNATTTTTTNMPEVILVNTCAIRDKAEERVKTRLRQFRSMKSQVPPPHDSSSSLVVGATTTTTKSANNTNANATVIIGVLGCMGERIKGELLKKDAKGARLADIVAGPDSYRDLPRLIENAILSNSSSSRKEKKGERIIRDDTDGNTSPSSRKRFEPKITETMNVELSTTETYSEIFPMRRGRVEDMSTSAFVTIQRGCDNMCAFCIVPFTRGRERSRDSASIVEEAKKRFYEENAREIVLLGQNVNSYSDKTCSAEESPSSTTITAAKTNAVYAEGFKSVYVPIRNQDYDFAKLLKDVCAISPELRVRFTSPHPKDFPDNLLQTIAKTPNASKLLHMPAQSGSTSVLERMNRGYSREAYLNLIDKAKAIIPDVAFSSDFISGFCGETEEEHEDTISLLKQVQYEQAFTFAYSLREKTAASKKLTDDVPEETKQRRLAEVIETFREVAKEKAKGEIGKTHLVLVEGVSKRDDTKATGRADNGKRVVFMNEDEKSKKGEYAEVRIREAGVNTLIGDFVKKTTAKAFYEANGGRAWYF